MTEQQAHRTSKQPPPQPPPSAYRDIPEWTGRPVAIHGWKYQREKVVTFGKVTFFLDDKSQKLIFAIAHQDQHGTDECISVPFPMLDWAESGGVQLLVFQRFPPRDPDEAAKMTKKTGRWTIPIAKARKVGYSQNDGELYVPFSKMVYNSRIRDWRYATETVFFGPKRVAEKAPEAPQPKPEPKLEPVMRQGSMFPESYTPA